LGQARAAAGVIRTHSAPGLCYVTRSTPKWHGVHGSVLTPQSQASSIGAPIRLGSEPALLLERAWSLGDAAVVPLVRDSSDDSNVWAPHGAGGVGGFFVGHEASANSAPMRLGSDPALLEHALSLGEAAIVRFVREKAESSSASRWAPIFEGVGCISDDEERMLDEMLDFLDASSGGFVQHGQDVGNHLQIASAMGLFACSMMLAIFVTAGGVTVAAELTAEMSNQRLVRASNFIVLLAMSAGGSILCALFGARHISEAGARARRDAQPVAKLDQLCARWNAAHPTRTCALSSFRGLPCLELVLGASHAPVSA